MITHWLQGGGPAKRQKCQKRTSSGSAFVACPVCGLLVNLSTINVHLDVDCKGSCTATSGREPGRLSGRPEVPERPQQRCSASTANFDASSHQGTSAEGGGGRGQQHCRPLISDAGLQRQQEQLMLTGQKLDPLLRGQQQQHHHHHQQQQQQQWRQGPVSQPLLPLLAPACVAHAQLPGQFLVEDFISPQEEQLLLEMLDHQPPAWHEYYFNGLHRGKAWGVRTDLRRRLVQSVAVPLPPQLQQLLPRMQQLGPLWRFRPNEANAIDYRRDVHQLLPHVDDRQLSGEVIVNLCLAGRVVMTFAKEKGSKHEVRVLLPPRALQVLTGPSRYSYTHAIARADVIDPRRVSITFRQTVPPAGG